MATKKTNKDYLLAMLKALDGKRAAAAGLKVLVEKDLVNDGQIMQLLHAFLDIVYETQAKSELKKLKKVIKK